MIPISTFNMLIAVNLILIVYSVIDHRNRLYANIVVAITAAILSAFIAAASVAGVIYDVVGTTQEVVNSPSTSNFFNFVSTVMFVYTIIMVYEVISEAWANKKQAGRQMEEGP